MTNIEFVGQLIDSMDSAVLQLEQAIKKDDIVIGILTGRQKDAMLPVDYHNNPQNRFAIPPKK